MTSDLSAKAERHLWMHFTRLAGFAEHEVPVIARGEGCYVFDQHGKRYLDGLSGLFTVQIGHGRPELGEAAARQSSTLGYFPVWSFAHEPAIELATRLAALAPGDLNRVFLTPSGGDAVETALKLSRQYWKLRGQPSRTKMISRYLAYHGTSMGALSLTGVPADQDPVRAARAGGDQGADAVSISLPRLLRTSTRARCGAPTMWHCASRWRAPTRSPLSSWSRCRTPAAPSLHPRATGNGSARSAITTTSCWSATR